MVDSWQSVLTVEVFWSKFLIVGPWETSVYCALVLSMRLIIPLLQRERGRACFRTLIFLCFFPESNKMSSPSSSIIQDIRDMCASGLATLAFFYCDFREDQKKERRGLLSSLLAQLCYQSEAYCAALSDFYSMHGRGSHHASDSELMQCLKDLLGLPGQATVYVIIDALDECPATTGLPSPREQVLELVEELVRLQTPNLRICITSRPEVDIGHILGPLAFHSVSIHSERGQAQDIAEYIRFAVNMDRKMKAWRETDKGLVIDVLTKKADGM
jgi:hypothetical protein